MVSKSRGISKKDAIVPSLVKYYKICPNTSENTPFAEQSRKKSGTRVTTVKVSIKKCH